MQSSRAFLAREYSQQRFSLNVRRHFAAETFQKSRHDVDRLRQRRHARSGSIAARQTHDQRNARDLVIQRHQQLHPVIVLGQKRPVIGGENDHRIVPQVTLIQLVEDFPDPEIGHRQERGVAFADVRDGFRRIFHLFVRRPIVERAVPVVAVHFAIFWRAVKRLVRIENLDLQKPIALRFAVRFQPINGGSRGTRPGKLFFFLLPQAVLEVLLRNLAALSVPFLRHRL